MASIAGLQINAEIAAVAVLADARGWAFERVDDHTFRITLPARDGENYQLEVDCCDYPGFPPALHWRDQESGRLEISSARPADGGYFHSSGTICAPWNRLASMAGGPHPDWAQMDWRENPKTGATRTLAAMIIRVAHELRAANYKGRHG